MNISIIYQLLKLWTSLGRQKPKWESWWVTHQPAQFDCRIHCIWIKLGVWHYWFWVAGSSYAFKELIKTHTNTYTVSHQASCGVYVHSVFDWYLYIGEELFFLLFLSRDLKYITSLQNIYYFSGSFNEHLWLYHFGGTELSGCVT